MVRAAAIAVSILVAGALPALGADRLPVAVTVDGGTNVGRAIQFRLTEEVKGSPSFSVGAEDRDTPYKLRIITMSLNDRDNSIVYSATLVHTNSRVVAPEYVSSVVGTCGENAAQKCASAIFEWAAPEIQNYEVKAWTRSILEAGMASPPKAPAAAK